MDISAFVKTLPEAPGVYLMKDPQGQILYVGKAIDLRKRVASYFQPSRPHEPKTRILVRQIADIQIIQTASEAEALLLEASLIKEWKPKYNIELRDDKSYPFIKVTLEEQFPRLFIGREKAESGIKEIGPFTDATLLRQAFLAIRRVFPFRTCRTLPKRPCLDYYMGLCAAPCVGKISREQYATMLQQVFQVLEGRKAEVLEQLGQQMQEASRLQNYEDAARLRDQIAALTELTTRPRRFLPSDALDDLRRLLQLPAQPRWIEGFDISNIHGRQAVGSDVVFLDGKPDKSSYKRFQIKTVSGIDDYAMMREVVRRRFREQEGLFPAYRQAGPVGTVPHQNLPDLVLIDGGKGHVAAAKEVLEELKIDLPMLGLAKEFEQIFLPGRSEPILLPPTSKALHLLQRVRDEAHRFAIGYHRHLRGKKALRSALDEIPGVGPRRRRDLLVQFGSVDAIKKASIEELSAVRGISRGLAERVQAVLKKQKGISS